MGPRPGKAGPSLRAPAARCAQDDKCGSLREKRKQQKVAVLPNRRPNQPRERRERRLRGVQPEPEDRVVIGRIEIGGLVPVRIPPCPDLRAAFATAARGMRGVACPPPLTPSPFGPHPLAPSPVGRGGTWRLIVILEARDVATAVAPQLRFHPV